jgi:hypothetical protein
MGNKQDSVIEVILQELNDYRLQFFIKVGSWFVEANNWCIFEQCSTNVDDLLFSVRKILSILLNLKIEIEDVFIAKYKVLSLENVHGLLNCDFFVLIIKVYVFLDSSFH